MVGQPTLQQVATAHGNAELLSAASTQAKIARNLGQDHPDLQRRYAAMLDIIFPKTVLSRLGGPPSEIVDVIKSLSASGIVTVMWFGHKGPHGFPFRRPHSHFPIHGMHLS